MAELKCEICGATEMIGTHQGYGLNQKLCGSCAPEVIGAQNAAETQVLHTGRFFILDAINEKKEEMRERKRQAGLVPNSVKDEIRLEGVQ